MKTLSVQDVYTLCNKKQYFTEGTCSQYDRMFAMVRWNCPIHDIAVAICICSSSEFTLDEIEESLNDIALDVESDIDLAREVAFAEVYD